VDSTYSPEGESYGLAFPYLLCVSNRKRHKNEFRVVAAFAQAGVNSELSLVFTGKPTIELARYIEQHHVSDKVHFTGPVEEVKLPSLYRAAVALVFPSLYEGFGLPVLEAMSCGTPVITANITALPEIAGDAALLVDPMSVEEIAFAMRQIVTDLSLRTQLREKGLARAKKFPWANTVAAVRNILSNNLAQ